MNERIPVIVVSGGEGAGKTRLLTALAARAEEELDASEAEDREGPRVAVLCWSSAPFNLDPLLFSPRAFVVDLFGLCPHCASDDDLLQTLDVLRRHWEIGIAFIELEGGRGARSIADAVAASDAFAPRVLVVTSPDAPAGEALLAEADLVVVAGDRRGGGRRPTSEFARTVEELTPGLDRAFLDEIVEDASALGTLLARSPRPRRRTGSWSEEDDHSPTCDCRGREDGAGHGPEDRGFVPFLFRGVAAPDAIGAALGRLDPPGLRARGLLLGADGRRTALHYASGELHLVPCGEQLPDVWERGSLIPGDEPTDVSWLEGASVVHVWWPPPSADPGAKVARLLDVELEAALAPVITAPEEAGADLDALSKRARALVDEERLLEGLTVARRALARDPASPRCLELLARCYNRLGEDGRAFSLLRSALERAPDDLSLLLNLARLHLAHDQAESAREMADRAARSHPDDPEAKFVMGSVLIHAGEYAEGAALLRDLVPSRGSDLELLGLLASACAELGLVKEAITYERRLVELEPKDEGVLYLLGHLLLLDGNPSEALGYLEQALEEGNETPWVLLSMGIAQARLGDAEDARECFEDSLQIAQGLREEAPDDASYLADQLLAEAALGQAEEARSHLDELLDSDGREVPRTREHLALLRGSPVAAELAKRIDRARARRT